MASNRHKNKGEKGPKMAAHRHNKGVKKCPKTASNGHKNGGENDPKTAANGHKDGDKNNPKAAQKGAKNARKSAEKSAVRDENNIPGKSKKSENLLRDPLATVPNTGKNNDDVPQPRRGTRMRKKVTFNAHEVTDLVDGDIEDFNKEYLVLHAPLDSCKKELGLWLKSQINK